MQIVWFKRDLRTSDHQALALAAAKGPILPLYILEPELWRQADMSARHYYFLQECLASLDKQLSTLGQKLIIKVGVATQVLAQLTELYGIKHLWSHQETWNDWTYQRDKEVAKWAKQQGITWHQPAQHGVIRCLANRDGWATAWYRTMRQACYPAPQALNPLTEPSDKIPSPELLGLADDPIGAQRQIGGRHAGEQWLSSFLTQRGAGYTKAMSSPVTAYAACSRISPYLAFGVLSMREVFHAAEQRQAELRQQSSVTKGKWPSALHSFLGRLRWHCHFMQKLEDAPRLEFDVMHSAYQDLRPSVADPVKLTAWQQGETGYPMVDACMRALTATGWLNFRMRAMLMSFASYHLWLDWRSTALHLARLFVDYEPGIHYSQVQMQSGTTGMNSIRIYNPIKQGSDHDPEGQFIRQWVPELANVPTEYIHTPWTYPASDSLAYPMPIVDEKIARKAAADQLYARRRTTSHRQEAQQLVKQHGSRKRATKRTRHSKSNSNLPKQGEFPI